MPTYTTKTKFTKPTPGLDTNQWGNLLNTTIDQIDRMFSGVLTHNVVTTPIIPEPVSGTDNTSRAPIYVLTGAQNYNINVYVPSISRAFWVINQTTGGSYTLTVYGTGGYSGVAVPRGVMTPLVFDGAVVHSTAPPAAGSVAESTTSERWKTPRTVYVNHVNSDVTGQFTIDGSVNVNGVNLTVKDDSHTHNTQYNTKAEITSLLAGKAATAGNAAQQFSVAAASTNNAVAIRRTDYATASYAGTVKVRVDAGLKTAYIRTDGTNA